MPNYATSTDTCIEGGCVGGGGRAGPSALVPCTHPLFVMPRCFLFSSLPFRSLYCLAAAMSVTSAAEQSRLSDGRALVCSSNCDSRGRRLSVTVAYAVLTYKPPRRRDAAPPRLDIAAHDHSVYGASPGRAVISPLVEKNKASVEMCGRYAANRASAQAPGPLLSTCLLLTAFHELSFDSPTPSA